MKFKIVAEDGDNTLTIPLTTRQVEAMQFLGFWFEENDWKNFKLNNVDKKMEEFTKLCIYLGFDVKDKGASYPIKSNGKPDYKQVSYHYLVKKPKWVKK